MPLLTMPDIRKEKIRATPPAEIPYPGNIAHQAYGGVGQIGAALARIGGAFASEILESQVKQDISQGRMLIEKAFLETYKQETRGIDGKGKHLETSEAQERFNNFNNAVSEIIINAGGRSVQSILQNQYNGVVLNYQEKFLQTALNREQSESLEKYAKYVEDITNSSVTPFLEGSPTVENLGKGIDKQISEAEQGILNWYESNPKITLAKAQEDIDRVNKEIPMNIAKEMVYPMGKIDGSNWIKKNWKKLRLNLDSYNDVKKSLDEAWDNERAIKDEEMEVKQNEVKANNRNLMKEGSWEMAFSQLDSSDTTEDFKRTEKAYIEAERKRVLGGLSIIDNYREINLIERAVDDYFLGIEDNSLIVAAQKELAKIRGVEDYKTIEPLDALQHKIDEGRYGKSAYINNSNYNDLTDQLNPEINKDPGYKGLVEFLKTSFGKSQTTGVFVDTDPLGASLYFHKAVNEIHERLVKKGIRGNELKEQGMDIAIDYIKLYYRRELEKSESSVYELLDDLRTSTTPTVLPIEGETIETIETEKKTREIRETEKSKILREMKEEEARLDKWFPN